MVHGGEIYRKKSVRYDFSVNINPLGVPGQVKATLSAAISGAEGTGSCLEQYPDQDCTELREVLKAFTGVPADRILCGNGASELIEAAVRAIRPKRMLLTAPSFSGYRHAAEGAGVRILYHELRRDEDFRLTERYLEDLDSISEDISEDISERFPEGISGLVSEGNFKGAAEGISGGMPEGISGKEECSSGDTSDRPGMAVLCNPANPVGNTIEPRLLEQIVKKCARQGTWLLVDECFLGFLTDENARTARKYLEKNGSGRLLVLDAFTKRFAMPGIRLGYLMAQNTDILERIHAQQPEWSVSVPAQAAGIAALAADMPQKCGKGTLPVNAAAAESTAAIVDKGIAPAVEECSAATIEKGIGAAGKESSAASSGECDGASAGGGAMTKKMSGKNGYLDRARALVASERKKLERALRQMGFRVFPGEANFVFFSSVDPAEQGGSDLRTELPERAAGEGIRKNSGIGGPDLREALLDKGILIRSCENYVGLRKGDYRVAVLSPEKNEVLLKALEEIMAESGKKTEILAVSFGTSYPETREKTIGAIEKHMADRFPEASVHRCFTSRMIRRKLLERDGLQVDSPEEAVLKAKKRGVEKLVVQPLYLMHGREHDGVLAAVRETEGGRIGQSPEKTVDGRIGQSPEKTVDGRTGPAREKTEGGSFEQVAFGKPLLTEERDFRILAEAVRRHLPLPEQGSDTAVLLMGHGTGPYTEKDAQDPNGVYRRLQETLRAAGAEDYYIATVEGTPRLEDILPAVCAGRYRKAVLAPLMIVAGNHAVHDLAGGGEDSWKSILLKKGFHVETDLRGIGEWEEVRELFAVHALEACPV